MRIILYFFLVMAVGPPPAQTPTPAELAEARVMTLEYAWSQAIQMGESRPLQSMLAESLIYIDYDGKLMSKRQYLTHVIAPLTHPEHIANEAMRAHTYGDSIVVTGIYHETGSKNGQPYELRERFVNAWIQQNGMWMCVSSQSTPIAHVQ